MAVKAPTHTQGLGLLNDFHLLDVSVATGASYACSHMDTVVEISVVRYVMNSNPMNRRPGRHTLLQGCEEGAVSFEYLMAIHTDLGRWNRGDRGYLDLGMAVSAVDREIARVQLMTIRDGLDRPVADIGKLRRCVVPDQGHPDGRDRKHTDHDGNRYFICPFRKNLCHVVCHRSRAYYASNLLFNMLILRNRFQTPGLQTTSDPSLV